MATVTGYTAQRMKRIEDKTVVDGDIVGDNLVLKTRDGTVIDAGSVRGAQGVPGPPAPGSAIPYAGAPGLSATNVEEAIDELAAEKADKTELTTLLPPGSVQMWAGNAAVPAGWLLCDGQLVLRATYPALFAAIGVTYGAGDGSTQFALPNLKGRVPIGSDATDVSMNAVGKSGGEKAHTNTAAEMPTHSHGGLTGAQNADHFHHVYGVSADPGATPSAFALGSLTQIENQNAVYQSSGVSQNHSHAVGWDGGGQAHNNMQPFLVMRYLIKV